MNHPQIGPLIVAWFEAQGRDLPWRDTRDPYRIWIAEVILQQTRIEQGIGYFYRFVERFPSVHTLAAASQDEVLKYWEGLGYYSRARNLHAAAQQLVGEEEGRFPPDYQALLRFKGIGPYTARAIGSFAFDNPTGVIDGNVMRVMARVLGDASPINQARTRKRFQEIVDQWVAVVASRPFNFGMMDLGATVCTPTKPGCLICPLQAHCVAYRQGLTQQLPYKEKKLKRKTRYFHFYLVHNEQGEFAIRQRPEAGFWGGLWEIPNLEVEPHAWQAQQEPFDAQFKGSLKHVFTHFDMMINLFVLRAPGVPAELARGSERFISPEKIPIFAFAKAVLKLFEKQRLVPASP